MMDTISEYDCEKILSDLGYKLIKKKSSSWVVKEPMGGRAKITTLERLAEYSKSIELQKLKSNSVSKIDRVNQLKKEEYIALQKKKKRRVALNIGYVIGFIFLLIGIASSPKSNIFGSAVVGVKNGLIGFSLGYVFTIFAFAIRGLIYSGIATQQQKTTSSGLSKFILTTVAALTMVLLGFSIFYIFN